MKSMNCLRGTSSGPADATSWRAGLNTARAEERRAFPRNNLDPSVLPPDALSTRRQLHVAKGMKDGKPTISWKAA
jgi:hypothetical protein